MTQINSNLKNKSIMKKEMKRKMSQILEVQILILIHIDFKRKIQ